MARDDRPLRVDAERNRRRLLDAATAMFSERGLEVGVGEIAHSAGIGRGTLFRNFPSKEHLIAAIVVDRMNAATQRGRSLADATDPGEALFEYLSDLVRRQQIDRALFDAVAETFLANEEIRAAHAELVGVLDMLLRRAQEAGVVRTDVGALDVLMLIKGICVASSTFAQVDPEIGERHLDLVRGALAATASVQPLRGRQPTLEDLERAFPSTEGPAERTARG